MKTYVKFIVLLLLFKIVRNLGSKNAHFAKLVSAKAPYVNTKLMDMEMDVTPFNKTVNFLTQSFQVKFSPDDNIFSDVSVYRVTRTNRSFLFSHFIARWKDSITMDRYGMDSLWKEHTHPPLYWPPKINVIYRTFGWAPDGNQLPNNLPAGDIKVFSGLKLQNRTKLYDMEWIFRIGYE